VKLPLDTHIWLWSVLEPQRLCGCVTDALLQTENEIWISPISTWEILFPGAKGRLNVGADGDVLLWIQEVMSRTSFREAPLTDEVILGMPKIALPHRDPADRFLAATAACFDLTLVTADENLIHGRGYSVLADRHL
jgi:PIN domain nuclease of toxin-antitoxin system